MNTNPFTIGNITDSFQHYGREQQLQQIIKEKNDAFLIGNRRSGKTWFLKRLKSILEGQEHCLAIYVDMEGCTNCVEMGTELLDVFNEEMSLARNDNDQLRHSQLELPAVIQKIKNECIKLNFHCYILIDEGEALINLENRELARLRKVIHNSSNVHVVITGSLRLFALTKRPLETSAFFNGFQQHYLPLLTPEQIANIIQQTQHPDGPLEIDSAILDEIQSYCGCQPFLVQRLCYQLFQEGQLAPIKGHLLQNDRYLDAFFDNDFISLATEQQKLLLEAQLDQPQTVNFLSKALDILAGQAQVALQELHQLGMLKCPQEGHYVLGNYFLAQWLNKKINKGGELTTMNHKTHLDQLIAEGDFGRAIKELLAAVRQNGQNSLYNDLIILSGRYNQQETAKLQGIISDDTYRIGMAKISQALIHYVDKYRPDGTFKFEPLPPPDDKGNQNETRHSAVFISYSRQDSPLAEKIKQYLESESLPVIMDITHLGAGENIQAFIERSIRESSTTLSLVSSRSLLSVWVANESMNSFYASRLDGQKFLPVFEDHSFFKRSFVDDALDTIEAEIADISATITKRLEKGRSISDLQEDLKRYKDLRHHLPTIVQRLKEHLSIDISANNFETGMQKIIAAIRS